MARRLGTPGAILLALSSVSFIGAAVAQEEDLTLPPRLEERPGETRLAAQEESRPRVLEEVIVVNESEWRLPDLGSAWRQEQEQEQEGTERIEVSLLPLFDPENQDPNVDLFTRNSELSRVGFVEIFRVRFGRRDRGRDDDQ